MVALAAILTLCTASIAFCVWFLVALCKDRNHHRIPLQVRLDADTSEQRFAFLRELERWFREAA
jgi:hypothetical protein